MYQIDLVAFAFVLTEFQASVNEGLALVFPIFSPYASTIDTEKR